MQQRVDPFIPVRGQAAVSYMRWPVAMPQARKVIRPQASPHTYEKTIDGFIKSSPASQQSRRTSEAAIPDSPWKRSVEPRTAKPLDIVKPVQRHRFRSALHTAHTPAIIAGAVGVGLLAPSVGVGEAAIGAYGLFAVARGVASRTTFLLALAALGVIIAALGLQGSDSDIGQNFAVYAFLLLAVGTVSLGLEARKEYA